MKLFIIMVLAGSMVAAQAQSVMLNVDLDGNQEVPSVITSGMGSGTLLLDTVTGNLSYTISYSSLTGLSTFMRIYQAPAGVNGSVIYDFAGAGFDFGFQAGTVTGSGLFPVSEIGNMLAGNTYVKIQTTAFPGGEIRGQIYVPEPAAASLFGLAGGALVVWRRRRL